MRRWISGVMTAAALLAVVGSGTVANAAGPFPSATPEQVVTTSLLRGLTGQDPTAPPPGVNRWTCQPTAAHPNPIVLVHGTGGNRYTNWAYLGPRLANEGYCVFALNYGGLYPQAPFQATDVITPEIPGVRPAGLDSSAAQINTFIDEVLVATHATQVDLVGHSQGALLALYIPKLTDHAPKVHHVIGLGSPTQGSTAGGLTDLGDAIGFTTLLNAFAGLGCEPCGDAPIPGGVLIQRLHAGGIAVPPIRYTMIASRNDNVASPAESNFIPIDQQVPSEQPLISNVLIQDVCAADNVGHVGEAFDGNVFQIIRNALDPAHATPVVCGPAGPSY
jgi:triacylglycerol esterase/lipase EstA (alpha/beta hydrolase family)